MYKRILFPVDVSDEYSWSLAFPVVVELLQTFQGSSLHVLTVVPDASIRMMQQYFPKGWVQDMLGKADQQLEGIVKENLPAGLTAERIISRGVVYQEILNAADRVQADLIVVSASCPGREEYLLGPNAAKVVRHSKISVLVVRDKSAL